MTTSFAAVQATEDNQAALQAKSFQPLLSIIIPAYDEERLTPIPLNDLRSVHNRCSFSVFAQ